jgi:WD40 repeat protein
MELARRVDEACNRFEVAWRDEARPHIEDFVAELAEPERSALARELILLDLYYRRRLGEAPDPDEYRHRFPDLGAAWLADVDADLPGEGLQVTPSLRGTDTVVATDAPEPGCAGRFGTYDLLEELGRGGMGIVYKARHDSLNRLVAVKMILMGPHAFPAERERFRREAEAAAHLDHPHIVPIYEVGECEGRPYFSMKLLEGGTLAGHVPRLGQDPRAAARLLAEVAGAVHYAHQHGILHRDLKPANILLDARGQPYVSDFGLARRVEEDSNLTQSGAIVGTPTYMAPEQALGQGKRLSTAADIYALGVILYELLTGRPPFKEATTLDTLFQVTHEQPVPPSRLRPRLPRDLETICLKCLEKEPHRRYGSARELADDLRNFLDGKPTRARPVGRPERLLKWARRRPMLAAVYGLLGLAAVLGSAVGAATWLWQSAAQARDQAEDARREASRARDQLDEANKKLERSLALQRVSHIHQVWKDGQTGLVLRWLDELAPKQPAATDVRGFEYYYLQRLCRLDLATWRANPGQGNDNQLMGLTFSPDGRRLASTGPDHTVKLWDMATGQEVLILRGHSAPVCAVAFSTDGRRLASAAASTATPQPENQPGEVKVWDLVGGRELHTLTGHHWGTFGVAFSPDGRRLASAGKDQTVRLWDADTGREQRVLRGHQGGVTSVAFSPDSRRLASGSMDSTIKVWDAADGREIFTLKGHTNYAWKVAFSPDGRRLASAGWDQTVKVWDLGTGQEAFTLRGHSNFVVGVAFSPDGGRLASASWDNTVKVWDLATRQAVLTLRGHTKGVEAVAFSPDGRCLASADEQALKIWDAWSDDEALVLRGHSKPVLSVAFGQHGARVASGGDDAHIKLWDSITGAEVLSWSTDAGLIRSVAFSPDGQHLASTGDDKLVKIWEAATGRQVFSLRGHAAGTLGLAYSADGRRLASGEGGATPAVKIWDAITGQELRTLRGHTAAVSGVAFSPDGHYLATGSDDFTARIWNSDTGEVIHTLRGHKMFVAQVAFSPDGSRLATAGWDRSVKLWDTATGELLHTFGGHTSWVQAVAFSPDGQRLVSAGGDRTWKIWDTTTFHLLLSVPAHDAEVLSVAFSPDGLCLATASRDHTVKIWDATPLTPETLLQRQARSVVQFLSARGLSRTDVLARLREDATLSEPVRQRALTLAGR